MTPGLGFSGRLQHINNPKRPPQQTTTKKIKKINKTVKKPQKTPKR